MIEPRVLRVVVCGATGRMGGAVARLARACEDVVVIGGIAEQRADGEKARELGYELIETPRSAGALLAAADALIDFSTPEALAEILDAQDRTLRRCALVSGTTGLDRAMEARLDAFAANGAVLTASNFSIGVNLLLGLVEEAARVLAPAAYDAEIVEAHHRRKVDAPSGTALALADAIAAGRGVELSSVRRDGRSGRTGMRPRGEVGMHAVRGGGLIGEHRVLFLGERERIELCHAALDREIFAEGAIAAARWIAGRRPGRYHMRDVLGL